MNPVVDPEATTGLILKGEMMSLKPISSLFLAAVLLSVSIHCACSIPAAPVSRDVSHTHHQAQSSLHESRQMPEMDCDDQVCLNDCFDDAVRLPEREPSGCAKAEQDQPCHAAGGPEDLALAGVTLEPTGPPSTSPFFPRRTPVSRFDRLLE